MRTARFATCLMVLAFGACSTAENTSYDKETIEPVGVESALPPYVQALGEQRVSDHEPIHWISCTKEASGPSLVMLSPGLDDFTKADSCTHPVALEGLEHGFNVLLINRPAQGAGKEDFGGDASLKQVLEALTIMAKDGRQFDGLWGYGDGSVLALRLARRLPWKFLVVGNGLYDWEQTVKETSDPVFAQRLQAAMQGEDAGFAERRSAAWDLAGLPKQIYLYHGGKNGKVPSNQVSQFRSSLAASEYFVDLFLLDEEGAELKPDFHRGVLSKILLRYQHKT